MSGYARELGLIVSLTTVALHVPEEDVAAELRRRLIGYYEDLVAEDTKGNLIFSRETLARLKKAEGLEVSHG